MKLNEYLKKYGANPASFGKLIGLSRATINNVILGKDINISTAYKIYTQTEGRVGFLDMIPKENTE